MDWKLSEFQRNLVIILRNNVKSRHGISKELREKYNKMETKRGMQYLWKKYLKILRNRIRSR